MKRLLTLLFLFSLSFNLWAQEEPYSEDPAKLVKQLQSFLEDTKRDDCKEASKILGDNFKNGLLQGKWLEEMYATALIMQSRKTRAYPYFYNYVSIVNLFIEKQKPVALFSQWSEILNEVIKIQKRGSNKEYDTFSDFSYALFSMNAIYASKAKVWQASTDNFSMSFEDGAPQVTFSALDLAAFSNADTMNIYQTKGTYYPLTETWIGSGGKVNWIDAGLPADQVYADVGSYTIEMDKPEFKLDTVRFYHKQFFEQALEGSYTDKLTADELGIYPQFNSFRKDLPIKNIAPNVNYTGGFSLHGTRILGSGQGAEKATITFTLENGKKVLTARSNEFLIKKQDEVSSADAEAALYIGEDSIYHPGLRLVYKIGSKELSLYRGSEGIAATAFFNSYHRQELEADAIVWKLDQTEIDIKMMTGAGQSPAVFRSANFFRKGELEKFQGTADFNPIYTIKMYAEASGNREMYADELAKRMNPSYTENTIKRLLYAMVEEGFIYYDEGRGLVTAKDKLFNYTYANADMIDYDAIEINSYSGKVNGKLNLENNEIDLEGVNKVILSDSQEVIIFPKDKLLTLQEDQDIDFSGVVFSGRIDFEGEGFHFDYDTFKVDLTNLAAAIIYVPTDEVDKDGEVVFKPLKSKIEGLTGYLEIDKPDNKSGKEAYPEYPIFTNRDKSFVYYDKKEIRDSAYLREDFFFEIEPFVLDSLNSFDPYMSDLKGRLVSAGIFPDIKEQLKIQPDLSFGFTNTTPTEGLPLYGNIGHYTDSILLSDEGLRGRGKVDYLFTSFDSKDIVFCPDSLDAVTDSFNMEKTVYKGVSFPIVKGKDNAIHWLPYQDSMFIRMRSEPFVMYEVEAIMKGDLLFTPEGLKGDGSFEFNEAALASNQFNFQGDDLDADTLGLQIKSIDEDKVTFNTPNVKGRVDLTKRIGEFKSNETNIPTEFSNNQYKTNINEFFWDMDANILDFKSPEGSQGEYFTSIRADQDSLKFLGKRAIFNMSTSMIRVEDVPEIKVADALIVTDSGVVTILPGGLLDSMTNAVVMMDTTNKYHRIYEANITVESRREYKGDGYYDYLYEGADTQRIYFSDIDVKQEEGKKKTTLYKSFANGQVQLEDSLYLNDRLSFHGGVNMQSERQFLEFDGFTNLNFADSVFQKQTASFSFRDTINPANVSIHYDLPKSPDGDTLYTGFSYDPMDDGIYPSLMAPRRFADNTTVFSAPGVVRYNKKQDTYTFGDEKKLNGESPRGNSLTYDEKKRTITGEGTFDLDLDLKPIKMATTGTIEHIIDSNSYVFKTFLAIDLPIAKELIEFFATKMNEVSYDKPNVAYNNMGFERAFAEIVPEKKLAKEMEELQKTGLMARPKDPDHNIIISNVDLTYSKDYSIYYSSSPISVSFIGEQGVHKQLTGYIEFAQRRVNDLFTMYFESSFDDWFYFSYDNRALQILSSNEDFNKMLAAIKPDKRTIKLEDEEIYFYTIATFGNMQSFLHRMHMIESGEKLSEDAFISDEQLIMKELEELKLQLLIEETSKAPVEDKVVVPGGEEEGEPADSTITEKGEQPVEAEPENANEKGKKDKKSKKDKEEDINEEPEGQIVPEGDTISIDIPAIEEDAPQVEEEQATKTTEPVVEEEAPKEDKKSKKDKKAEEETVAVEEDSVAVEEILIEAPIAQEAVEDSVSQDSDVEVTPVEEDKKSKKDKKKKQEAIIEEEQAEALPQGQTEQIGQETIEESAPAEEAVEEIAPVEEIVNEAVQEEQIVGETPEKGDGTEEQTESEPQAESAPLEEIESETLQEELPIQEAAPVEQPADNSANVEIPSDQPELDAVQEEPVVKLQMSEETASPAEQAAEKSEAEPVPVEETESPIVEEKQASEPAPEEQLSEKAPMEQPIEETLEEEAPAEQAVEEAVEETPPLEQDADEPAPVIDSIDEPKAEAAEQSIENVEEPSTEEESISPAENGEQENVEESNPDESSEDGSEQDQE